MQKLIWQNSKGEEINLTSGHYGITNWEGFSEVSSNVQSQTVPFQDGSVYLDALLGERELSVTLAIQDNNDLELRYQLRRELIHALNPKLNEGYLIYTNDFISKRIKCVASVPIFENHNSNDSGTPKASLTWTACEPYWEDLEETEVLFDKTTQPQVLNNGDIPVNVKIDISCSDTDSPTITNLNNNKLLSYNGNLNKNLLINTNTGKKSAETYDVEIINQLMLMNYNSIMYSRKYNTYIVIGSEYPTGSNYTNILVGKDLYKLQFCEINKQEGYIYEIAYSEEKNLFVIVGVAFDENSNTVAITYTSNNATDWVYHEITGNIKRFSFIKYFEELDMFVALGDDYANTGMILTSVNGTDWNIAYQQSNNKFYSIFFNENKYIICGDNGSKETTDFITFTSTNLPNGNAMVYSPKFNSYYIVQIFSSVSGNIIRISNGTEQICTSPITQWNTKNNIKLYADEENLILINDDCIYQCLDGVNFQLVLQQSNTAILNVTHSSYQGYYYIMGENSLLDITTNFQKINQISILEIGDVNSIAYSDEKETYIALLENEPCYYINTKGYWEYRDSDIGSAVEYYKGNINKFITSNKYSSNGEDWEDNTENIGTLKAFRERDSLLIAIVGNKTKITRDGLTWQSYNWSGLSGLSITKIVCLDGENFVIIAEDGKAAKSTDGINWTVIRNVQSDGNFYDITYSTIERIYYVIGTNKTYITDLTNWIYKEDFDYIYLQYNRYDNNFYAIKNTDIYNGALYKGVDVKSLEKIKETNYFSDAKIKIIQGNGLVFVYGNAYMVSTNKQNYENAISKLTENSDMGFRLEVGENVLRLNSESGNFGCSVKYRQKYIGV